MYLHIFASRGYQGAQNEKINFIKEASGSRLCTRIPSASVRYGPPYQRVQPPDHPGADDQVRCPGRRNFVGKSGCTSDYSGKLFRHLSRRPEGQLEMDYPPLPLPLFYLRQAAASAGGCALHQNHGKRRDDLSLSDAGRWRAKRMPLLYLQTLRACLKKPSLSSSHILQSPSAFC